MKLTIKISIFMSILLALCFFVISLGGCSIGSADTSSSPESLPDSSVYLDEKYEENPELLQADIYAEHYDVTTQEALQRFDISDAFSGLDTELEIKEPETFAGLWIQHTPKFCIVVAFTRDGEETIKKYVSEDVIDYVEVRKVKYSMVELWEARNQVEAFLRDEDISFDSGIYVMDNRVEINVTDRTTIDAAVLEGTLVIPECVVVNVVEGLAVPLLELD